MPASDPLPQGIPPPRANPLLLGQEAAEAALLAAAGTGRLAHAWLFTGPQGIGKATLAFRFARYLLAGGQDPGLFGAPASLAIDPGLPVFKRVASGGHADLRTIERPYDDKRQRLRSEIPVDDVRVVSPFLAATAAEGGWRIVIIDGADAMNRNAANALLKILEEPPERAMLILTASRPSALPATVLSRCRRLVMPRLSDAVVMQLARQMLPALADSEAAALATASEGSIGRAIMLAEQGGLAAERRIAQLLDGLTSLPLEKILKLCEEAASAEEGRGFALTSESLRRWLGRVVRAAAGGPDPRVEETKDTERIRGVAKAASLDRWLEVWDNTSRLLSQVEHANLDRKQALLSIILGLRSVLGR